MTAKASADWHSLVPVGLQSVRTAGRVLSAAAGDGTVVTARTHRDIKTVADRDANEAVISELSGTGIPVLSEELESGRLSAFQGRCWILDPLDGTMNFTRGVPLSCVSLALWDSGEPLWGVVHDFFRNESYVSDVAVSEAGMQPIGVSGCRSPKCGVLATGFPNARSYDPADIGRFVDHVRQFSKVRLLGSAALSLAWLAAGKLDAYTEQGIYLWDVAAGLALVRAAGGVFRFSNLDTSTWKMDVVAAATPDLLQSLESIARSQA